MLTRYQDVRAKSTGNYFKRPLENQLSRLVELWQISQPLHLRHLTIIRDATLTNNVAHFVHYTYDHFKARVESGKASWEAVQTIADGKKGSMASLDLEPDLDEYGFPKLANSLFQGQHNDATPAECMLAAKVEPFKVSIHDPRVIELTDGSYGNDLKCVFLRLANIHLDLCWVRGGYSKSRLARPKAPPKPPKLEPARSKTHDKQGRPRKFLSFDLPADPQKMSMERIRRLRQSLNAAITYQNAKIENEVAKRIEMGGDPTQVRESVLAEVAAQAEEPGGHPLARATQALLALSEASGGFKYKKRQRIDARPAEQYLPSVAAHTKPLVGSLATSNFTLDKALKPKNKAGRPRKVLQYLPSVAAHTKPHLVPRASSTIDSAILAKPKRVYKPKQKPDSLHLPSMAHTKPNVAWRAPLASSPAASIIPKSSRKSAKEPIVQYLPSMAAHTQAIPRLHGIFTPSQASSALIPDFLDADIHGNPTSQVWSDWNPQAPSTDNAGVTKKRKYTKKAVLQEIFSVIGEAHPDSGLRVSSAMNSGDFTNRMPGRPRKHKAKVGLGEIADSDDEYALVTKSIQPVTKNYWQQSQEIERTGEGVFIGDKTSRNIGKGRPRRSRLAIFKLTGLFDFGWFATESSLSKSDEPGMAATFSGDSSLLNLAGLSPTELILPESSQPESNTAGSSLLELDPAEPTPVESNSVSHIPAEPKLKSYKEQYQAIQRIGEGIFIGDKINRKIGRGYPKYSRLAIFKSERLTRFPWFVEEPRPVLYNTMQASAIPSTAAALPSTPHTSRADTSLLSLEVNPFQDQGQITATASASIALACLQAQNQRSESTYESPYAGVNPRKREAHPEDSISSPVSLNGDSSSNRKKRMRTSIEAQQAGSHDDVRTEDLRSNQKIDQLIAHAAKDAQQMDEAQGNGRQAVISTSVLEEPRATKSALQANHQKDETNPQVANLTASNETEGIKNVEAVLLLDSARTKTTERQKSLPLTSPAPSMSQPMVEAGGTTTLGNAWKVPADNSEGLGAQDGLEITSAVSADEQPSFSGVRRDSVLQETSTLSRFSGQSSLEVSLPKSILLKRPAPIEDSTNGEQPLLKRPRTTLVQKRRKKQDNVSGANSAPPYATEQSVELVQDGRLERLASETSGVRELLDSGSSHQRLTSDVLHPEDSGLPFKHKHSVSGISLSNVEIPPSETPDHLLNENPLSVRESKPSVPRKSSTVSGGKGKGKDTLVTRLKPTGGSMGFTRKKIIIDIVEKCGGIFPGEKELYCPFVAAWLKQVNSTKPDQSTIHKAAKAIFATGKLKQLVFAFTSKTGVMVTKSMILAADISTSASSVKEMQKKIMEQDPRLYIPAEVEVSEEMRKKYGLASNAEIKSGRHITEIEFDEEAQVQLQYVPSYIKATDTRMRLSQRKKQLKERLKIAKEQARKDAEVRRVEIMGVPDFTVENYEPSELLINSEDAGISQFESHPGATEAGASRRDRVGGSTKPKVHRLATIKGHRAEYNGIRPVGQLYSKPNEEAPGEFHVFGDNVLPLADTPLTMLLQIPTRQTRFTKTLGINSNFDRSPSPDGDVVVPTSILSRIYGDSLPAASVSDPFLGAISSESQAWPDAQVQPELFGPYHFENLGPASFDPRYELQQVSTMMDPDHVFHPATGTFSVNFSVMRKSRQDLWKAPPLEPLGDLLLPRNLSDLLSRARRLMRPSMYSSSKDNQRSFDIEINDVCEWELQTPYLKWVVSKKWCFINHKSSHVHEIAKDTTFTLNWPLEEMASIPGRESAEQPRTKRAYHRRGSLAARLTISVTPAKRKAPLPLKPRRLTSLLYNSPMGQTLPTQTTAQEQSNANGKLIKRGRLRGTQLLNLFSAAEEKRLITAVVVIRILTGGLERNIDWTLVSRLFEPKFAATVVHRRWRDLMPRYRRTVEKMQDDFQEIFPKAYEDGLIPPIDFDDLENYDWSWLVDWTEKNLETPQVQLQPGLPNSRSQLDDLFQLRIANNSDLTDFYEFNSVATSAKRQNLLNKEAYVIPLLVESYKSAEEDSERLAIARSWVRANIITSEKNYNPDLARAKLSSIAESQSAAEAIIERALDGLLTGRLINVENKGRFVPARNYDISQYFLFRLTQTLEVSHFRRAAAYKTELDKELLERGTADYSYHAGDGETLVLLNMVAHHRISLVPKDPPMKKFGLSNGYKIRQMDKSLLSFVVEVRVAPSYISGNPLWPLPRPPFHHLKHKMAKIPLWYDIHGNFVPVMWEMVLAATMAVLSMRPGVGVTQIEAAMRPAVEQWELTYVLEWGVEAGAVRRTGEGKYATDEWWWLCLGSDETVDRGSEEETVIQMGTDMTLAES